MEYIPYGRQDITEADIDAVVDVLRSDWLTQGPKVPEFENAVAGYCGATHAVAVNSATSALHIACLALGLGKGDRLWTSANTFVASANCARYCGADVDFVDIDQCTYNMSAQILETKLKQAKTDDKLPKVIIPVHFAGQPCDMPVFHQLSQEYGFKIIEDASHAVGASYQDIKVGSCIHSDITIFSFHPVKVITTGEGGMALTNDSDLAERISRYRSHGITTETPLMRPRPSDEIWNYQQIELGFNYRMTDIQAALGASQLQRLDDFIRQRHAIARLYDEALNDLPVITPWQHPNSFSSYHLYPIRIRERLCGKKQRQVVDTLLKAGIGVNLHYIPVYLQPYYQAMGFNAGYCPESELYYKEAISLPIYSALKDHDHTFIIDRLKEFFA
jgi:UDP-4-amino-4,6-dideoxy-N-acetyl-beta-L-altrosamine transaminase